MSRCVISKRVKIPKKLISKETVENELIVRGKENDIFNNRDPMVMFEEFKDYYIVPAMFGWKYIKKNNLKYKDIRLSGDPISVSFNGSLRDDQIPIVETTIETLKNDYGTILVAGCGMGKTCMSNYISSVIGLKPIILVHTSILLEQWIDRISQFVNGAKIGTIKQNKFDIEGKTHVVASAQTIVSRTYEKNAFDSFGLLIVDECHNFSARTLSKTMSIVGTRFRLGLSATPYRKDCFDKVGFHLIGQIGSSIQRDAKSQELNVECIHVDYPDEHHTIHRKGVGNYLTLQK